MFGFLKAIFSTGVAIVKEVTRAVEDVAIELAVQFRSSETGRKIEEAIKQGGQFLSDAFDTASKNVSDSYRRTKEISEEEQELARKKSTDGKLTESDKEKLEELYKERKALKEEINKLQADVAVAKLQTSNIISVDSNSDELSANVGIMSTKTCKNCGGYMRIRQGPWNTTRRTHNFWWQCISNLNGMRCPTEKIDLRNAGQVLRSENPDLDGNRERRNKVWNDKSILEDTIVRVKPLIKELDNDLMCPVHAMQMQLEIKTNASGLLLDTFEYVCSSNKLRNNTCNYTVPITTFPQISSLLRRNTGEGIIDAHN